MLDAVPGPAEPVIEVVDTIMSETTKKRMSAAAMLRAEGRVEGKAEGRAEGVRESHVRLLRALLRERFGAVPAAHDAAIANASLDELERWAVRTMAAGTLADVFGGEQG